MSGSRGPISKPAMEKQLRRTRNEDSDMMTLPAKAQPAVIAKPEPPKGLRKRSKELWNEIWESPVSIAWDTTMDLAAVERYVTYFDEWLVAQRDLRGGGFRTTGSQGQDVLDPSVQYVRQLESQMNKLETQLGLTPMARARLGLTLEETKLTAAQANRAMTPSRKRE